MAIVKPRREYKSFDDFVRSVGWKCSEEKLDDKQFYPCMNCHGSGKVIADYERPDPNEGYKNADMVTCQHCCGTGEGTKEALDTKWDCIESEYQNSLNQYYRKKKEVQKILNDVTPERIELLRDYFSCSLFDGKSDFAVGTNAKPQNKIEEK